MNAYWLMCIVSEEGRVGEPQQGGKLGAYLSSHHTESPLPKTHRGHFAYVKSLSFRTTRVLGRRHYSPTLQMGKLRPREVKSYLPNIPSHPLPHFKDIWKQDFKPKKSPGFTELLLLPLLRADPGLGVTVQGRNEAGGWNQAPDSGGQIIHFRPQQAAGRPSLCSSVL